MHSSECIARMSTVAHHMQRFGTLSFGHYGPLGGGRQLTAGDSMLQAIDLAQGMDDLGVDGTYFRVHHFARQQSSPMPLLAAIAARTKRIEVGTGVIDMRYENPLYLAEEAASVDLISDGRLALGVSRGSPETVVRGYETFGYTGSEDPRGADIARDHFATFLRAIEGEGLAERDAASPFGGGDTGMQRIEPHSPGLRSRIWWGAGNSDSAEWAGRIGVNLMSSTLLTEYRGLPFDELQAQQIEVFRAAWRDAGHAGEPRASVSRSIFPITTAEEQMYFGGRQDGDQVGVIDGMQSTFGKTYAAAPDVLVEQLLADAAIRSADTLMLTIPSQLGRRVQPASRRVVREVRRAGARLDRHARRLSADRAARSAQEGVRVELVDRDDADARQRRVEHAGVVLQVELLDALERVEARVAELGEGDDPHPAVVADERTDILQEVAVVADEHDIGGASAQRLQRPLDGDVDDLLVRRTGQGNHDEVHRLERLDERHRDAGRGVEEEHALRVL